MHRRRLLPLCVALTLALGAPARAQIAGQAPGESTNPAPPKPEAAPSSAQQPPNVAPALPQPKPVRLHAKAAARNSSGDNGPAQPAAKPVPAPSQNIPSSLQDAAERIAGALEAANSRQQPADEQSRLKRYYKSQLRIARWTKGIFVVAALETLVIAFGASFLGLALMKVRTGASETKPMEDEVKRRTEGTRAEPRPHLFVVNVWLQNPPKARWLQFDDDALSRRVTDVNCTIENFGQTPAIIKELRGGVYVGADLPLTPLPDSQDVRIYDVVVPTSGVRPAPNYSFPCRAALTKEAMNNLFRDSAPDPDAGTTRSRFFFWVAVRYEGPYRSSDEFGALWEYRVDLEQWVPVLDRPNYAYRRLGWLPQTEPA